MEERGWQRASPGSVLGSIAARARSPAEYAIVLRSLVEDQHGLRGARPPERPDLGPEVAGAVLVALEGVVFELRTRRGTAC